MNKGFIYLIITVIFFSSYEVVGRMLTGLVNPYQLNFVRFLIGGLLLLPLAINHIKNKKIKLTVKDMLYISLIGLVNVVLSMSFFQIGINATKASLAAVIFSSNPLFCDDFSLLYFKRKSKPPKDPRINHRRYRDCHCLLQRLKSW